MKVNCLYLLSIIWYVYNPVSSQNVHPNVVLIIVDDLRPTLSSYGDRIAVTPHIDEIADSGIIFSKAYAQQALCGPSRTSLLTSRRPNTLRLTDVHYYWRQHAGNFTTLPQYFKEHGFETVSAGKVFHPGIVSNHNDDQPFSWSEAPFHPSSQSFKNKPVCLSADGELHSNIYCPVQVDDQPEQTLPDIQTTEYVINWLKWKFKKKYNSLNLKINSAAKTKPFFLAVGLHKPHIPLKFPVEFLDLYPINTIPPPPNSHLPKGLPLVAYNPWNDLRIRDDIKALNVSFPFGPVPDFYARYIRQGYYAATSYIDSLIGLIFSTTRLLFPDTIVAFIGDHGWSLGEHQEWSKYSNYEVSTRVPFIISLPTSRHSKSAKSELKLLQKKLHRNFISRHYFNSYVQTYKCLSFGCKNLKKSLQSKRYDGVVELIDLFPTLVDLAGLPTLQECSPEIDTCTEGLSLSCLIKSALRHDVLSRSYFSYLKSLPAVGNYFSCPRKIVAISQYPRPGVVPTVHPDSDQPRLTETKIMGYSLRSNRFRYTSWHPFDNTSFHVNWNKIYGEELYDHFVDDEENNNIVSLHPTKAKILRKYLKYYLSENFQGK